MSGILHSLADAHFFHEKIWAPRGFSSMEEHNDVIMDSIIHHVGRDDVLMLGGDTSFGSPEQLDALVERHLPKKFKHGRSFVVRNIMGNHCKPRLQRSKFIDTHHAYVTKQVMHHGKKLNVIYSHIPIHPSQFTWNGGRWDLNIHGHLHTHMLKEAGYMSACWELWQRPVTISELIKQRYSELNNDN